MMDQLALYRVDPDVLDKILGTSLLADRELVEYIERRGRFVNDLFLDGKSVGKLLAALSTILGIPLDALVHRTDLTLEPSGPVTWTSRIPEGTLTLLLKGLGRARRLLSDPSEDPGVANRLAQLAVDFGGASQTANALHQIQRQLEAARGGKGDLVSVFTCWKL